ncbi:MAG: hypothetical protein COV74_04255 [Candidatus Omnitrophica bacterium CG11_big_fil_rev_8_21_14_0_20_45_26]|uniref:SPOR domain-containing protein n=1 Tax=Candidatus Abzuiibacterium crystallinum TaxID=1974748 RepID=A0A2H0LQG7_9BACT|nr:MAG: hypothetical protein COV74_04255 [Candidatus Omnitrophica bacterium CG11_big_fil_rev_8_21_14_0_20_45_26]PIW63976.1 MAG: hypothetical protein COW12_08725 [Candidatus Omnitrophica bacterium CG12_big_fil_rev_8_21_14_0_65_45_16]
MSRIVDALQNAERQKRKDVSTFTFQTANAHPQTLRKERKFSFKYFFLSVIVLILLIGAYQMGVRRQVPWGQVPQFQLPLPETESLSVEPAGPAEMIEETLVKTESNTSPKAAPALQSEKTPSALDLIKHRILFYTVQLVTYQKETQAQAQIGKLQAAGHDAYILPGGRYFRVCLGTYETYEEAKSALPSLKEALGEKAYGDAFIRLVRP